MAAALKGLTKGFTYDKKGNWRKRSGKTQKCSNVIGNKSKSTKFHIKFPKRERAAKCYKQYASVTKMKQKDYAIVRRQKQTTDASAKRKVTMFDPQHPGARSWSQEPQPGRRTSLTTGRTEELDLVLTVADRKRPSSSKCNVTTRANG